MRRRTLMTIGFGSAAFLAIAGVGMSGWGPGVHDRRLTARGRTVLSAVALAVLDGSLPQAAAVRESVLAHHLDRIDAAVAAFPTHMQDELSQLLAALSSAPGRIVLAGLSTNWPDASVAEVQAALESMRLSSLVLRQQAYHALRDLTNATFYADPHTWRLLSYPGPLPV